MNLTNVWIIPQLIHQVHYCNVALRQREVTVYVKNKQLLLFASAWKYWSQIAARNWSAQGRNATTDTINLINNGAIIENQNVTAHKEFDSGSNASMMGEELKLKPQL